MEDRGLLLRSVLLAAAAVLSYAAFAGITYGIITSGVDVTFPTLLVLLFSWAVALIATGLGVLRFRQFRDRNREWIDDGRETVEDIGILLRHNPVVFVGVLFTFATLGAWVRTDIGTLKGIETFLIAVFVFWTTMYFIDEERLTVPDSLQEKYADDGGDDG